MSHNAMRLITRLRTVTAIAGLTALLIALGALIGGGVMWLFAAIAATISALGYRYSDRLALRAARPLDEAQAPEVHATVRELSARAGIPMPRLYLMSGERANAFAAGRNPEHAAVVMTEGLLIDLPLEHVRGVLAHELSHIRHRDVLVSSVAATIAGAISAIVSVLQLSLLFEGGEAVGPLGMLGPVAAMLLASLGAMLLALGASRRREYLADASAAQLLGSGAPLAEALEEITRNR